MPERRPKALVATTVHWASTTRLCLALFKRGFDVAAVAPAGHGLNKLKLKGVAARYVCNPYAGATPAIAKAIRAWAPDILIPGDDSAVTCLHEMHTQAARDDAPERQSILDLIARSLGDHRSFSLARKKSAFIAFARAEGLAVPYTAIVRDVEELRHRLVNAVYPQVLKLDGSSGGYGVRIVRSATEAERDFRELLSTSGWPAAIRRAGGSLSLGPLLRRWRGEPPTITLQHYVAGRPANRAVACWDGTVLAGISGEALHTVNETGPATVVRIIENQQIEETVAHLVRRLRLSGLVGFDFVLDAATDQPLLIEMNSRPTPICHLFRDRETDLIGALSAKVGRTKQRQLAGMPRHEVIALFPQELWRDPASEYLRSSYHDVPWEEPQLVAAYARPVPPYPRRWPEAVANYLHRLRTRRGDEEETATRGDTPHIGLQQPAAADLPPTGEASLRSGGAYQLF
jgi:glutathione synthase/RimK-type ligase-like ATP-grasp enzyme